MIASKHAVEQVVPPFESSIKGSGDTTLLKVFKYIEYYTDEV
jgi:hypothetical protein